MFKKYKKLKYLAYHDALTGVLNMNWYKENMHDLSKFKYVYFIDINNLKIINQQGHDVGDKYIKLISDKLSFDKNNILIRYAGDEFILFSNDHNAITTNELYSVGRGRNTENSIRNADLNMIYNKKMWKSIK